MMRRLGLIFGRWFGRPGWGRRTKGITRWRRNTSLIEQPKRQHDEEKNDGGRYQSQEDRAPPSLARDRPGLRAPVLAVVVLRVMQSSQCSIRPWSAIRAGPPCAYPCARPSQARSLVQQCQDEGEEGTNECG